MTELIAFIIGVIIGYFVKSLRQKSAPEKNNTKGSSSGDTHNSNPQVN